MMFSANLVCYLIWAIPLLADASFKSQRALAKPTDGKCEMFSDYILYEVDRANSWSGAHCIAIVSCALSFNHSAEY